MMKLSSSWPNGRMLVESEPGATSWANFSAEFNGGRGTADLTEGTDFTADWTISSMSRAISSPETSMTRSGGAGGGGGGGTNSILDCGVTELTAAAAVTISSRGT